MNILITGGSGYIASGLKSKLFQKYNITTINRNTFDLTDYEKTKSWFSNKFFDVVIHTAIKGGSRLRSDTSDIIDTNLQIYLNLLQHKHHYKRFINIGSGAEVCASLTPYGLSKRAIYESIQDKDNFYSLRIFGIFDDKELNTRFIKANLLKYIQREKLIIHKNKRMDDIVLV